MTEKVTARFYIREVTRLAGQTMDGWAKPAPRIVVKMSPVSGARGEGNKAWASATPSGEFSMTIGNEQAAQFFDDHLGEDVAITIELRPIGELEKE